MPRGVCTRPGDVVPNVNSSVPVADTITRLLSRESATISFPVLDTAGYAGYTYRLTPEPWLGPPTL